ncbi:MAG TPA: response regulator [Candidatus Dormibacteraeota bacterium]|nr:response regulator [Candidatus Dormibacteraeota bacterium]
MGRNRFLLLIDDDRELGEVVAVALAQEGFAVRVALDAETALHYVNDDTALVLLDVLMPGMEACEFARRYRSRAGHVAPVVVFSASSHAKEFAEAIDAAGVLQKPFELEDLIELANRHLGTVAAFD